MTAASPIKSRMQHGESAVQPRSEELVQILPELYDELRSLAARYLRGERLEHTLQRTALVHEAYLRIAGQPAIDWQNRAHFFGIFARVMRQVLTNYAVARSRMKRGGTNRIDLALEFYERKKIELPVLDTALRDLERIDPRQGQIVELRFFGGLTIQEIADAMKISPATVKREWTTAKMWLHRELARSGSVNRGRLV